MPNTPTSKIQLFKTQLTNDYSLVANFSNKSEFEQYLQTQEQSAELGVGVFIEKNKIVRVPLPYDTLTNYNYVVYNNGNGNEYAFISEHIFTGSQNSSDARLQYDCWSNYIGTDLGSQSMVQCHRTRWAADNSPLFLSECFVSPLKKQQVESTQELWFQNQALYLVVVFSSSIFTKAGVSFDVYEQFFTSLGVLQPSLVVNMDQFPTSIDFFNYIFEISDNKNVMSISLTPYPPVNVTTQKTVTWEQVEPLFPDLSTNVMEWVIWTATDPQQPPIYRWTFKKTLDIANITKPTSDADSLADIGYEPQIHQMPNEYYLLWNQTSSFQILPENIIFTPDFNPEVEFCVVPSYDGVTITVKPVGGWYKGDSLGDYSMLSFKNNAGFTLRNNADEEMITGALGAIGNILGMVTAKSPQGFLSSTSGLVTELYNVYGQEKYFPSVSVADAIATNSFGGLLRLSKISQPLTKRNEVFDTLNRWGYPYSGVSRISKKHAWFDYYRTNKACFSAIPDQGDRVELEAAFNRGVTLLHPRNGTVEFQPWTKNNIEET